MNISEPDTAIAGDVPTIDSADLYQHFRNFRYAKMSVNGLGSAYPDAVAFIDDEVQRLVGEFLKGIL